MPRPKFAVFQILWETMGSLFKVFRKQKITSAYILAFVVLVLAMIFAFLAFTPILSPFVYPLF